MHLSQSVPLFNLFNRCDQNKFPHTPTTFCRAFKRPSVAKGGPAIITQLKINGKEWGGGTGGKKTPHIL